MNLRNVVARTIAIGAIAAQLALVTSRGPAQEAAPAVDDSVTTRWLPDPFPNLPPRVLDRHATVEMDTAARTPRRGVKL